MPLQVLTSLKLRLYSPSYVVYCIFENINQNEPQCQFHQFLVSSSPCGLLDNYMVVNGSETSTTQAKFEVTSFSTIAVTARTEEGNSICQMLGECHHDMLRYE